MKIEWDKSNRQSGQLRFSILDLFWLGIAVNVLLLGLKSFDALTHRGSFDLWVIPLITYTLSVGLLGIYRASELKIRNPFARALYILSAIIFVPGFLLMLVGWFAFIHALLDRNQLDFFPLAYAGAGFAMLFPAKIIARIQSNKDAKSNLDSAH